MHLPIIASLILAAADPITPMAEQEVWQAVQWIVQMKGNRRGPYEGVMWFCEDGTILPPKLYACTEHGGGLMYGILGREAKALGGKGIYLGTVLAALEPDALVEANLYRARALVIETYLERALDGWVLQAARTYRGFRQIEDEIAAARELLMHVMMDDAVFDANRSLAIRLIRSLPYGENSGLADQIRALASEIGDTDREFEGLRFKIHAMPEPSDIDGVITYAEAASPKLSAKARELADTMRLHYDPVTRLDRLRAVRRWVSNAPTRAAIDRFVQVDPKDSIALVDTGLALMGAAERALADGKTTRVGERNLLLLHVIELVEELWIGITADLSRRPMSRQQAMELALELVSGARIVGLLSAREEQSASASLVRMQRGNPHDYVAGLSHASRVLEWGRARVLADLGLPLARYSLVEPRAANVIDDILRSGVMLPLAAVLDRLTADAERLRGGGHQLLGVPTAAPPSMRGENPGLAVGPLRVLTRDQDPASLKRHEVVLLRELPPELPPIAGVITLGATGSLAHVSLLARNLGIPHASVDADVAAQLVTWSDQQVVLGVSAGRRVVIGPPSAVGASARVQLAARTAGGRPLLEIDTERLRLDDTTIVGLDTISEKDAGVRCGPKAAELGRLRRLFPTRVSNAAVIPFGAFLRHVDRAPAEGEPSPMARLRAAYARAKKLPPRKGEVLVLGELARFREAIATTPFADGFEAEVESALATLGEKETFGVFVRSDTNVEDLKEFTGAGLNRTVPNRVSLIAILAAIRKVWASPFSERSFRWRQQILKNPEHVYPSVILHKTVASQVSGVMVTLDLETGETGALTLSASEGVAAVVDGGAPETLVVRADGQVRLLASSRTATRKLIPRAPREGVTIAPAEGRDPLLDQAAIDELRSLAAEVVASMPESDVPWDIEFGLLSGRAWLFQIRPLRASKSAATHPFLIALDEAARLPSTALDLSLAVP